MPSEDGSYVILPGEADEPPNFGPPMHIRHGVAEAFYVLEASTSSSSRMRNIVVPREVSSSSQPRFRTDSASVM